MFISLSQSHRSAVRIQYVYIKKKSCGLTLVLAVEIPSRVAQAGDAFPRRLSRAGARSARGSASAVTCSSHLVIVHSLAARIEPSETTSAGLLADPRAKRYSAGADDARSADWNRLSASDYRRPGIFSTSSAHPNAESVTFLHAYNVVVTTRFPPHDGMPHPRRTIRKVVWIVRHCGIRPRLMKVGAGARFHGIRGIVHSDLFAGTNRADSRTLRGRKMCESTSYTRSASEGTARQM